MLTEEVTGEGIPLEAVPVDSDGLLRVQIVHACEKIGHPRHLELDGSDLEPGIALENPRKDHGGQGNADIVLFVRPLEFLIPAAAGKQ